MRSEWSLLHTLSLRRAEVGRVDRHASDAIQADGSEGAKSTDRSCRSAAPQQPYLHLMSHYKHAPGKPPCKAGAACHFKKADHWQSFDHPDSHPRLMRRAQLLHGAHKQGEQIDRSMCSLKGKTGDDPKTAKYICAGCGTSVIGFGRWRNHMKRSKQRRGERNDPRKRSNSSGSSAPPAVLQRYGVGGASASAPSRYSSVKEEEEKYSAEEEDEEVEEEDEEEEDDEEEDDDEEEESSEEEEQEAPVSPAKKVPAVQEKTIKKQQGTRWIGEVGKNGKRQRKFF